MSDTKGRYKKLKPVWFFSLVGGFLALTLAFQNCSGFELDQVGGLSSLLPVGASPDGSGMLGALVDSEGNESVLYSFEQLGNLAIDKDLLFLSYSQLFDGEVAQVYWDHYLINAEGSQTFCAQSSPEDNMWQVLINCEQPGELRLMLTVIYEDSIEDYNFYASVEILSEAVAPPDPNQPAPNDPTPLSGADLYNMNCAGCHGVLNNTNKANRSAAQIQGAIDGNVGNMGFLSSLRPEEVQAIATALAR